MLDKKLDIVAVCIGIAKEIYNDLGSGFNECVYQKAFEVSLRLKGIKYESQRVTPIFFKGFYIGEGEIDLVVYGEEKLVVELKATALDLSVKEEIQIRKYMTCLKINQGLLINFRQSDRKVVPEVPEIIQIDTRT